MSSSGSRPAYLDEFERKLAAALAQQADAKKTRLASVRLSDANLSSLGEALPRSSGGVGAEPLKPGPLQPSSETHEKGTPNHEALTVSVQRAGVAIAVGAVTEPLAGGNGAIGANQSSGELLAGTAFESALKLSSMEMPAGQLEAKPSDLVDGSSTDCASQPALRTEEPIGIPAEMVEAFAAELSQAISDDFPQGGGNGPELEIAAEGPVTEAARRVIIETAHLHTDERGVADVTRRGSRGWRFKALALTASVVVGGVMFLRVGGMLAPASGAPGADGPKLSQNATPAHLAAEQAPSGEALAPSAAPSAGSDLPKDHPDVNSAAVVATPTAPPAAETAAVDAIQPAGGTSPVSIVSTPEATSPAAPPLAQSFNIKPVPTVSPQPAPITSTVSSAELSTEGSSKGYAPPPTAKPTQNVRDVRTPKPLAPKREGPMKVVDKPSARAVFNKNNTTGPDVAVRALSPPLPLGTPAMHDNMSKEPNAAKAVVESAATAAIPAATLQPSGLY